MIALNEKDFLNMMQSDSKLWETAESETKGDKLVKTIYIPWGIGETTVTLEGLDNVNGRRAAFSTYGEYIRGLVDNQISEESITARAEQAAARASDSADRQPDTTGPSPQDTEAIFDTETVPSFEINGTLPANPADKLAELKRRCTAAAAYITETHIEINALEAYMEIINASGNKKPPSDDSQTAVEEESE